jgi:hypothetical protein
LSQLGASQIRNVEPDLRQPREGVVEASALRCTARRRQFGTGQI